MPSHEWSADLAWRHPCLQLLRVMVVEVHEQFLKGMNAAYWYTTTVSCSKKGHRMIGALSHHFRSRDEKRNRLTTDAVSHPHSQGRPHHRLWSNGSVPRQPQHRSSARVVERAGHDARRRLPQYVCPYLRCTSLDALMSCFFQWERSMRLRRSSVRTETR